MNHFWLKLVDSTNRTLEWVCISIAITWVIFSPISTKLMPRCRLIYICLFHLVVQKYFDHAQKYFEVFNIIWTCSIFFWPWSKVIFYRINLHIWALSKLIDHIPKILNKVNKFWMQPNFFWTSRWIRVEIREIAMTPLFLRLNFEKLFPII